MVRQKLLLKIQRREPIYAVGTFHFKLEGMIPAQNERWRRGLGMQVEREAIQSILRESEDSGERRKGE